MNYFKLYENYTETTTDTLDGVFWRWFGDSKTISDGEPVVFYHGTNNNFSTFGVDRMIKGWLSKGFYFTDNQAHAENYGKVILPVYLRIQNPFIIEGDVINSDGSVTWAKSIKEQIYEAYPEAKSVAWDSVGAFLSDKGYDGIISSYDLVVVFSPNQIKSIDNDGSWDISDNDIYS
jgi:hypothetical protein